MYGHHVSSRRRKKRPMVHGIKNVQVSRGKSGYGFTISGQHPCVLSCIVGGSPADLAGLKAGDYLYIVNGVNVSHAPHDDVVRMVGQSTGTLELQVAENYNSSDSSEDDYPPRTKSRYPNRVRFRQAHLGGSNVGGSGASKGLGGIASRPLPQRPGDATGSEPRSHHVSHQHNRMHRNHIPVGADLDLSTSVTSPSSSLSEEKSRDDRSRHDYEEYHRQRQRPVYERIGRYPYSSKVTDSSTTDMSGDGLAFTMAMVQTRPVINTAKISSAATKRPPSRLQEAQSKSASLAVAESMGRPASSLSAAGGAPLGEVEGNAVGEDQDGGEEEIVPQGGNEARAVVGYIGSIELPANLNRPNQQLQQLRNAVRRLRVEQKIHTLVLMQVDSTGVRLTNDLGGTVAHYTVDKLAFSGLCPDDKRFFGIVTLHSAADDISEFSGCADGGSPSSSCHVFMVDPDMCSHLLHAHKARAFGFTCTPSLTLPQRCLEFPHSPTSLILCIAALYCDRPRSKLDHDIIQSHAFADPSQPSNSSNSNSSNSDSGFGRDDAPAKNKEPVCIVEMCADKAAGTRSGNGDNSSADSSTGASSRDTSSSLGAPISRSMGSLPQHLSPLVTHPLTTPFSTPQGRQRPMSAFEIRRGLNNSSSSEECWAAKGHARIDKLTPRAMPDPATTHLLPRAISHEGLNSNTSAENLRQSMQRLLQARQQQLQNEQALSCSDSESQASHAQPYPRSSHNHLPVQSAFQVPRPVSAPLHSRGRLGQRVADLGFGKLSPRAIQPLGKATRSPSAPPAPYFPHQDSDDDDDDSESEDDPFVRTIITQFTRDRVLDLGADGTNPRRFSEGYTLGRQRDMEQAEREELHKWTKAGSFRRHHNASRVKANVSQSHESLAVADGDGGMAGGLAKMVAASSVNSMAVGARGGMMEDEEEDSLGRVARWAVGLPRLLSDPVGLSIFTEFLKKEFSQENITFWTAVEVYRQLSNEDMRRSKAYEIYNTHLSSQACEPVNVDSTARLRAEQHLTSPVPEMFDTAQTQIFHLMRTDSYTRFLKSDLYKGHLMREMEGHTLLVPHVASSKAAQQDLKKKGKGKENEDKRRKSLLPWRQNKKAAKEGKSKGKEEKKEREMNNNLKKAPGPGIDLSTMRKEVFQPRETEKPDGEPVKFCRVVMPDTSTTVVCTRPGHTIRGVLGKLCDKRGISIAYVDVFLLGSDKPLNLEEDISSLGSKEVVIERRVLFRLDLPNHKSIGVKAKPNRCIRDVFKPILNKYGYHMDQCGVQLAGLSELLDLDIPVSDLDNQRVHVVVNSDRATALPETGVRPQQAHRQHRTPLHLLPVSSASSSYPSAKSRGSAKNGSLEEITNQIFEDLMKGKSELAHTFDELGVVDLEHGRKTSKNNDEHRSLGLFGRLRNESWRTRENNKKGKSKGRVTFTLPRSDSKKKKKAAKAEEPARAEDQHPASSSSGVRNDLASFMASSCVETVDMATFTAENNPLLLPPPDMFDDVHYMHSRLADVANGATDDDDGEEDAGDFSVEPYSQTTTPRFLTFGTPRSKSAPSAFTSAKKQLVKKEENPYLSAQPVIVEAESGGSAARREAYREKGDLQTLGVTISPHFDDTVHTFRPTRLGPSAASALGSFKVPLASPDHVLGGVRVSPGRECTDLGAMQRLRPIPARRNLVRDASGTTPPKTGTSQMEVSVEVHQCTEAQQGVKQPNPLGSSQDKSASRISPHSLDRTPPSPHLSPPSPSLLQSSPPPPHHPSAAPEYTPPPPYSAAVNHSAVGPRAKMSPSPAKSRGTPRPSPPNNDGIIHSETQQRLSPPSNSGTPRLLPPNSGEMLRLSPPNNDGTQKHSPPNSSATHRGTHGHPPPSRQSAIPVPAPRGGSGMSGGGLVPRGKMDGEALLGEELAAQQSRASPFPLGPHTPSQTKRPHVKSPLNHDRPPVPRSQSSSAVNQPASVKQVEGICSPSDNPKHSPGTQADHLAGSVPNARRPVAAGPLGPNRSGSLDSVMAAGGDEEGRGSLRDGDFLGGKEAAKHLIWSNMNSNTAQHSCNVASRTSAVNGYVPEVAWGSGYQKKTDQLNGYVIHHPCQGPVPTSNGYVIHHPRQGPVPTRGSQSDSTSFSGTLSPCHFSHPSDLNNPEPHQGLLAGSGTADDRGGLSHNGGAHLFMQAFDASGFLEQTVTFV